ncbi:hypothetical protein LSTR_LSTR016617 [Laodelphax striatellus]|uniref:Fork-head domain-containing protein n=1 Tax=Laodelphax striatellus TaxID=195883 RepID=A0A482XSJ6_LAOST|nr:hypothetical protein LSTR_LSTR016617 [Laodelphax striatellus]
MFLLQVDKSVSRPSKGHFWRLRHDCNILENGSFQRRRRGSCRKKQPAHPQPPAGKCPLPMQLFPCGPAPTPDPSAADRITASPMIMDYQHPHHHHHHHQQQSAALYQHLPGASGGYQVFQNHYEQLHQYSTAAYPDPTAQLSLQWSTGDNFDCLAAYNNSPHLNHNTPPPDTIDNGE